MERQHVVIVGAGPAGVATAVSLRDRGLHPVLIERADVAASWRGRYDRLKLNTGKQFSHLPRRIRKGRPAFPTRDQVVDYFDRHAHVNGTDLRLNSEVERIDKVSGRLARGDVERRYRGRARRRGDSF